MPKNYPTSASRKSLANDVLRSDLSTLVAVAVVAVVLQRTLTLSELFPWKVVAVSVVGAALVFFSAMSHLRASAFGPANRVTLARGGFVALLFGLVGDPAAPWVVVLVASGVLVLDGIDGWLARRFGMESGFGARFDMETDALLMMALACLAWDYEKAGPWILLAGLMRYLFTASGWLVPALRGPLPPRRRRQTAFVFQAVALIACISPVFAQPLSGAIALLGLAVLGWSFTIDVVYLTRHGELVERPRA